MSVYVGIINIDNRFDWLDCWHNWRAFAFFWCSNRNGHVYLICVCIIAALKKQLNCQSSVFRLYRWINRRKQKIKNKRLLPLRDILSEVRLIKCILTTRNQNNILTLQLLYYLSPSLTISICISNSIHSVWSIDIVFYFSFTYLSFPFWCVFDVSILTTRKTISKKISSRKKDRIRDRQRREKRKKYKRILSSLIGW